jgi:hypothetical protein
LLRGYKKDKDHLSYEFQDTGLPEDELGSIGIRIESSSKVGSCSRELREMAVEGD